MPGLKEKRIRATAKINRDGSDVAARMRVPREIREYLSARINDVLVLEAGNAETVARAAELGSYVIVRRAPRLKQAKSTGKSVTVEAKTESDHGAASKLRLKDDVRRKLDERSGKRTT